MEPPDLAEQLQRIRELIVRGSLNAALSQCERVCRSVAGEPAALFLAGIILLRMGRARAAVSWLTEAAAVDRRNDEVLNALGAAQAAAGMMAEAVISFRRAVEISPLCAQAHVNLAESLCASGDGPGAERCIRAAIAVHPANPEVRRKLGDILIRRGRLRDARNALNIAISGSSPSGGTAELQLQRALAFAKGGRARAVVRCLTRAVAAHPTDARIHSALLYASYHLPESSDGRMAERYAQWCHRHLNALPSRGHTHANEPIPDRKLRVGYISADLREHSLCRFLEPLIQCGTKADFACYCYSDTAKPDMVTRRLRATADGWRETRNLSDADLAALVRQDGIDVLVDPTGHMVGNRQLVFARKPAPVQVSVDGYPGPTGLPTMDGFVTDHFHTPLSQEGPQWTPRPIRLPASARCYWIEERDHVELSEAPAVSAGHVMFGSVARPMKITPAAVSAWAAVLRSVPGSRMLLLVGMGAQEVLRTYRRLFQRAGVEPDRLEFLGPLSRHDYLRVFHRIDVNLDTFPYNGCTTTCDALWMGVPTVTLTGQSYVSRAGLSILSQVGLQALCAGSDAEYVNIATGLADNGDLLRRWRTSLRDSMIASDLCNGQRFATSFETAVRELWVGWCDRSRR